MANDGTMVVTMALPYANGDIHLGHLLEATQADIWVRFHRLRGRSVVFVCGNDMHGTPIMTNARKAGVVPETFALAAHERHKRDLNAFAISFDNFSHTHTERNRKFCEHFYREMVAGRHTERKAIEQWYCEHDRMFLPDRYVKGTCPSCNSPDQYGDQCEVCSTTYGAMSIKDPRCSECGNPPTAKVSEHVFFRLRDYQSFLSSWVEGRTQPEMVNKLREWLTGDLRDWCLSRDEPYFGFTVPDMPGKYFYVWVDAPIGYISSLEEWAERQGKKISDFWPRDNADVYHFIGKDILYFHTLFWPAMLQCAGFAPPAQVFVHGMLTSGGEKLSKSRGTFINASTFLRHLEPSVWRYYLACKLNAGVTDVDLTGEDFVARVNSDLIGKITNLASRTAQMLEKNLGGEVGQCDAEGRALVSQAQAASETVARLYTDREFSRAMLEIRSLADAANKYFDDHTPWQLIKTDPEKTRAVLTAVLNTFRVIAIYLKPVIPDYVAKVEALFGEEPYRWQDVERIYEQRRLNPFTHLAKRIELKSFEAIVAESRQDPSSGTKEPAATTTGGSAAATGGAKKGTSPMTTSPDGSQTPGGFEPVGSEITIDDFQKIDLRVARILSASEIPEAKKLLKLELDFGFAKRTIFAGIKADYAPGDLQGRLVIAVANLKPRVMKFGTSEGMVLAASFPEGPGVWLLSPDSGAAPGARVS